MPEPRPRKSGKLRRYADLARTPARRAAATAAPVRGTTMAIAAGLRRQTARGHEIRRSCPGPGHGDRAETARVCPRLRGALQLEIRPRRPDMTKGSRTTPALAASWLVCLLAFGCSVPPVAPSIEFTTVPRADAGGPSDLERVAGRVRG